VLVAAKGVDGAAVVAAADDGTAGIGVGAGNVRSGLSPEGKVALVRALQGKGRRVLFVGDGVNDAAAIAAADAGVAVRGCSASSAQAAGALLQREDLGGVVALVRMSRATRALVLGNWAYAAAYNLVAMPLAAGALWPATGEVAIPLALAGASEAVSTLPVIASALLLWLVPLT
jgi:Cu+-exporting ATPase